MNMDDSQLIYKDEVFAIMGAAFEVHNQMGHGFTEPVYQELLELELTSRGIPFEAQKEIHIHYKGKPIKQTYRADFLVYGKIIIEIKALERITKREDSQLLNYLKATGLQVGLLINFGSSPQLEWKRFANTGKNIRVYSRSFAD
jgi:GxxExxY protein